MKISSSKNDQIKRYIQIIAYFNIVHLGEQETLLFAPCEAK